MEGGPGGFLGSKVVSSGGKPWRPRAGPTECAIAVEDEVFEEEESAEVLGGLARPCHPDYVRGRRIQPAERGPGGGLTATYFPQLDRTRDDGDDDDDEDNDGDDSYTRKTPY